MPELEIFAAEAPLFSGSPEIVVGCPERDISCRVTVETHGFYGQRCYYHWGGVGAADVLDALALAECLECATVLAGEYL